jgi:hypothetical protein
MKVSLSVFDDLLNYLMFLKTKSRAMSNAKAQSSNKCQMTQCQIRYCLTTCSIGRQESTENNSPAPLLRLFVLSPAPLNPLNGVRPFILLHWGVFGTVEFLSSDLNFDI